MTGNSVYVTHIMHIFIFNLVYVKGKTTKNDHKEKLYLVHKINDGNTCLNVRYQESQIFLNLQIQQFY